MHTLSSYQTVSHMLRVHGVAVYRISKVEQEKTDKMLIKSLEREERERKRVKHLICVQQPAMLSVS